MSHVHRTQVRRQWRYSWNSYEWIAENIYVGTNIFSKCIYLAHNIFKCLFMKQTIILCWKLNLEVQLTINQYIIKSLWPRHIIWWHRSLQWCHSGCDAISDHQHQDCLLNRLFRHRSEKTSKLHITGLSEGNSPVTGEFPAQRASNMENVSIWWWHHVLVNIGSGNGFCLPAPSHYLNQCWLIHKWGPVGFMWGQFQRYFSHQWLK